MDDPRPPNARPDDQTLDELEGVTWGPPAFGSHVVTHVHRLRTVPLKDYRVEDLRLMIGQGVGLTYLLPRALDRLELHPFAEGDHYPGDLLAAVAAVPDSFWNARPALVPAALRAIDGALARIASTETVDDLVQRLLRARQRLAASPAAP
jgi:hypothetical protein